MVFKSRADSTGGGGGGVSSLNGQVGIVTLTSVGATINITTPGGNTVNIESVGGGGYPTTLPPSGIVLVNSGNSPYSVSTTEVLLEIDTSTTTQINLPNPNLYRIFKIIDISGLTTTNNITLHRFGSEKILGITADKILATNWGSWVIESNGTDWFM